MYGCIQNSLFSMTAEIYHQIVEQDPKTNELDRRWVVLKNIECIAAAINESGGSTTSDNKMFNKEYSEDLEIKLHTNEQLSKRWRVSKIRNSSNQDLYLEIDKISKPSTIFEVYSSHPIFDLYGNIQYYENHLRRTSVQEND